MSIAKCEILIISQYFVNFTNYISKEIFNFTNCPKYRQMEGLKERT